MKADARQALDRLEARLADCEEIRRVLRELVESIDDPMTVYDPEHDFMVVIPGDVMQRLRSLLT